MAEADFDIGSQKSKAYAAWKTPTRFVARHFCGDNAVGYMFLQLGALGAKLIERDIDHPRVAFRMFASLILVTAPRAWPARDALPREL